MEGVSKEEYLKAVHEQLDRLILRHTPPNSSFDQGRYILSEGYDEEIMNDPTTVELVKAVIDTTKGLQLPAHLRVCLLKDTMQDYDFSPYEHIDHFKLYTRKNLGSRAYEHALLIPHSKSYFHGTWHEQDGHIIREYSVEEINQRMFQIKQSNIGKRISRECDLVK